MRILFRYIHKYLIQNISSTLLSILSIAVASSLFFFVFNLGLNTTSSYQQLIINSYGNYHASFSNVSDNFLTSLKLHVQIDQLDEIEKQKIIDCNNFIQSMDGTIHLMGMDESTFKDLGYLIKEGRYPKNNHEILISPLFISSSKSNLNLNDTIILDGELYTIVGITSSNFLENKSFDYVIITLPIDTGKKNVYIRYDNIRNTNQITKKIANDFENEYDELLINKNALSAHLLSFDPSKEPVLFWIILIFTIFISMNIILIRNSYKNSYLNREKHLAILKTVGVTNTQCKRMMLFEGLLLLFIGLCVGLTLGIFFIIFLIPNINKLLYSISIESIQIGKKYLIWTSLVTILYTSFISIYFIHKSTQKILHQNVSSTFQTNDEVENCNIPYLQLNKNRNILWRLFNKNIRQNFRSYRHLIIGVIIILSLLILWNGMMGYLRDSNFLDVNDYNYDVEVSFTSSNYPTSLMTKYKMTENASDVVISETLYLNSNQLSALNRDYFEQNNIHDQFIIEMISYSDEVLENFILSNSQLNEQQFSQLYDVQNIHGILINQMYHPAHRRFYSILNSNHLDSLTYENVEVISKFELISTTALLTGTNYQRNPQVILTRKIFDLIAKNVKKDHEYHLYFQSSDSKSLVRELNSLNNNTVDNYVVKNVEESLNYGKSMIALIRLFSYGFIICLIIMSILAFFCLAANNFDYRRKELVLYHVLGLRIKDMMILILMEVSFYLFFILLFSWLFSQVMNLFIYKLVFEQIGLQFFIPSNTIFGSIALVVVILIGFMGIIYVRIKSEKYSEVLKNDISLM